MSQLLFLMGCIPARLLLAFVALYLPIWLMPLYGIALLGIGLGFLYLFVTGKRKTGLETEGKPIWWRPFRIVHGLMYCLAAFFVLDVQRTAAFKTILIDTCFGLALFLRHYFL